jgi:hypothetical protein
MKTTFQKIKDCKPCGDGWKQLISYHKPSSLDEEISIKEIMESNGLNDAIWALRVIDNTEILISLSIDLAESVLHIYEKQFPGDTRIRDCIDACKKYIRGEISESELIEKKKGAYNAYDAAYDNGDDAFAARVVAFAVSHAAYAAHVVAYAISRVADDAACAACAADNTTCAAAARAAIDAALNADKSDRGREAIKDILLKY